MITKFKQIYTESPEEYELYKISLFGDYLLATASLRQGILTVKVPDKYGKEIFEYDFAAFNKGKFYNRKERKEYLNLIRNKVLNYYNTCTE